MLIHWQQGRSPGVGGTRRILIPLFSVLVINLILHSSTAFTPTPPLINGQPGHFGQYPYRGPPQRPPPPPQEEAGGGGGFFGFFSDILDSLTTTIDSSTCPGKCVHPLTSLMVCDEVIAPDEEEEEEDSSEDYPTTPGRSKRQAKAPLCPDNLKCCIENANSTRGNSSAEPSPSPASPPPQTSVHFITPAAPSTTPAPPPLTRPPAKAPQRVNVIYSSSTTPIPTTTTTPAPPPTHSHRTPPPQPLRQSGQSGTRRPIYGSASVVSPSEISGGNKCPGICIKDSNATNENTLIKHCDALLYRNGMDNTLCDFSAGRPDLVCCIVDLLAYANAPPTGRHPSQEELTSDKILEYYGNYLRYVQVPREEGKHLLKVQNNAKWREFVALVNSKKAATTPPQPNFAHEVKTISSTNTSSSSQVEKVEKITFTPSPPVTEPPPIQQQPQAPQFQPNNEPVRLCNYEVSVPGSSPRNYEYANGTCMSKYLSFFCEEVDSTAKCSLLEFESRSQNHVCCVYANRTKDSEGDETEEETEVIKHEIEEVNESLNLKPRRNETQGNGSLPGPYMYGPPPGGKQRIRPFRVRPYGPGAPPFMQKVPINMQNYYNYYVPQQQQQRPQGHPQGPPPPPHFYQPQQPPQNFQQPPPNYQTQYYNNQNKAPNTYKGEYLTEDDDDVDDEKLKALEESLAKLEAEEGTVEKDRDSYLSSNEDSDEISAIKEKADDLPDCPGTCISQFLSFTCFRNAEVTDLFKCPASSSGNVQKCCAPKASIKEQADKLNVKSKSSKEVISEIKHEEILQRNQLKPEPPSQFYHKVPKIPPTHLHNHHQSHQHQPPPPQIQQQHFIYPDNKPSPEELLPQPQQIMPPQPNPNINLNLNMRPPNPPPSLQQQQSLIQNLSSKNGVPQGPIPTQSTQQKNSHYICGLTQSMYKARYMTSPAFDMNALGINKRSKRIVGGRDSVPGEWCWQVALINSLNQYLCGGALIGTQWVLTAAHCVTNIIRSNQGNNKNGGSESSLIYVRVGDHDLTSKYGSVGAQTLRVQTTYIHHNHNSQTLDNDIALLKLSGHVQLMPDRGVCLVCLPSTTANDLGNSFDPAENGFSTKQATYGRQFNFAGNNANLRAAPKNNFYNSQTQPSQQKPQSALMQMTAPKKYCTVTGYGYMGEAGPIPLRVREAKLPLVEEQECLRQVNAVTEKLFVLPASSFCAGGEMHNDACQGDGGGPLVCLIQNAPKDEASSGDFNEMYYELTGLVSWGFGCGRQNVPGVYVKVASFIGWINQIIASSSNAY